MVVEILFNITILAWLLSELWILARDIGKTNAANDNNTRLMIVILVGLGITLSTWISRMTNIPIVPNTGILTPISIIIIWIGIILRQWAVQTLGKLFRTHVQIQKDHKVIQSGPYKYIRHPSYAAALISMLGYGITFNNWLSLAILMCVVLAALYRRIIIEEKVLAKYLGKEYQNYQKRTKKLIPYIY